MNAFINNRIKLISFIVVMSIIAVFFLAGRLSAQESEQAKQITVSPDTQSIIDGIVANVNDDSISFNDIALELLVQSKLDTTTCITEEILERIIEDQLIFQELSNFPPTFLMNTTIDITEEYDSLVKEYKGEDNLKKLVYALGLTPEDVSRKLRTKKIIYVYLNYKLYSSIFISVDEIKDYYEKNAERLQKSPDDNYYNHFEEIKIVLTEEKTLNAYKEYSASLKSASTIIVHKEIMKELKKRC